MVNEKIRKPYLTWTDVSIYNSFELFREDTNLESHLELNYQYALRDLLKYSQLNK